VPAPPDPVADWLARLAAAQPAEVLQRLTNVEAQLTVHAVALAALAQENHQLKENLMATAEEFAQRLDVATNEIATDLQSLRDQLQAVRDQIPAAQQAAVDTALAQLDAPIARLEALGQDPADPIPGPAPAPEPAPVEPAPAVDENGNPV
jgi:chromosome segregation ATPase